MKKDRNGTQILMPIKSMVTPVSEINGPYKQAFSKGNEVDIVYNFIYHGSDIDFHGTSKNEIRETSGIGKSSSG